MQKPARQEGGNATTSRTQEATRQSVGANDRQTGGGVTRRRRKGAVHQEVAVLKRGREAEAVQQDAM
jgi:hypothetical protein